MTTLSDQARLMIAYNEWADLRIIDAAEGLTAEQFDGLRATFAHMLGTQVWWYALWTAGANAGEGAGEFIQPDIPAVAELRPSFERGHANLRAYTDDLTDEGWHREEPWWKQWGYDQTMAMGETLFQVVEHGVQHRSEIAVVLTSYERSPGDLDYLNFRQSGG